MTGGHGREDRQGGPDLVEAEVVFERSREAAPDVSHLRPNRRLIVRRALMTSAASHLLPVPVADTVISERLQVGLFQKLARQHGASMTADAGRALAAGGAGCSMNLPIDCKVDPKAAPKPGKHTATQAGRRGRWWPNRCQQRFWRCPRRTEPGARFLGLAAGRGAGETVQIFQRATLLDHYFSRHHTGDH